MNMQTAPDERVLWQGQPAQGFHFAPQDLFAVPFAAFWLLIVIGIFSAIIFGQAQSVDPIAFIVMPLFLLVGLYMLVGRFLIDRAARRRTHYRLTNQRVIIESGLFKTNLRSVSLAVVPEIQFRSGRKGRGTIRFGSPGPFSMMPPSWPGASQFSAPAFDGIEDAERIYGLALGAQKEAQIKRAK